MITCLNKHVVWVVTVVTLNMLCLIGQGSDAARRFQASAASPRYLAALRSRKMSPALTWHSFLQCCVGPPCLLSRPTCFIRATGTEEINKLDTERERRALEQRVRCRAFGSPGCRGRVARKALMSSRELLGRRKRASLRGTPKPSRAVHLHLHAGAQTGLKAARG